MKPIHNLLRQRLYRTQKPLIEHPPIDLLSAFSERALGGPEHTSVVKHLAGCVDCRDIVFLAAPEVTSQAGQVSNFHPSSRWISWPVVRWGTVAACAVIVLAAVRLRPNREIYSHVTVAAVHSQQTPQKAVTASPSEQAFSNVAPVQLSQEVPPVRRPHGSPGKAKAVPRILGLPPDDSFYRQMALLADVQTDMRRPLPRWTLVADGTLQRSLDDGISWKRVYVAHDHTFRAIAVAGRNVWLGGKKGVLFHSADAGQHWAQMKPTTDNPLPASDILGIEFEDELHGKLTTASNESWATSDGGRNWEKQ